LIVAADGPLSDVSVSLIPSSVYPSAGPQFIGVKMKPVRREKRPRKLAPELWQVAHLFRSQFVLKPAHSAKRSPMATNARSPRAGSLDGVAAPPGARSPRNGAFRKEGEYWTGKSFRLEDTKGLGYLAHLLRYPALEFHVLDLAGGIASQRDEDENAQPPGRLTHGAEERAKAVIQIGSLGDAGERLDEPVKAAYSRRLSELREELEEAKEVANVERAEQAEEEIDALTRALARAVGLGGRDRRMASASERARQSVTKTIKAAVERIVQSDAVLGDIFSPCIRTGTFCAYQPDPDSRIVWEFGVTDAETTSDLANAYHGRNNRRHPLRCLKSWLVLRVVAGHPAKTRLHARKVAMSRRSQRSLLRAGAGNSNLRWTALRLPARM
jgi:hypothetical protein